MPSVIKANFTIDNPLTNSKTKVIESEQETNGEGWLLEVTCQPKARPDIKEYVHLGWTETFEIVSGEAFYEVNGTKSRTSSGESFSVTPGQKHVHPWCAGNEPLVYLQRDKFDKQSPEAVQEVLGVFATTAELAREGKVNKDWPQKSASAGRYIKNINQTWWLRYQHSNRRFQIYKCNLG